MKEILLELKKELVDNLSIILTHVFHYTFLNYYTNNLKDGEEYNILKNFQNKLINIQKWTIEEKNKYINEIINKFDSLSDIKLTNIYNILVKIDIMLLLKNLSNDNLDKKIIEDIRNKYTDIDIIYDFLIKCSKITSNYVYLLYHKYDNIKQKKNFNKYKKILYNEIKLYSINIIPYSKLLLTVIDKNERSYIYNSSIDYSSFLDNNYNNIFSIDKEIKTIYNNFTNLINKSKDIENKINNINNTLETYINIINNFENKLNCLNKDIDTDSIIKNIVESNRNTKIDNTNNIKSNIVVSDRKSNIVESYKKSNIVESDKKSNIVESDKKSNIVESDKKSNIVESDKKSNIVESDKKSNIVESDKKSNIVESDKKSNIVESDKKSNIIESDIKCHIVNSDDKNDTINYDKTYNKHINDYNNINIDTEQLNQLWYNNNFHEIFSN